MKKFILFLLLLSNLVVASSLPKLDFFKTIGGSGDDGAYDLVIDNNGNIFVLGWYTGSIDLNPNAISNFTTAYGNRDIFLAKYDSVGNYIWGFGLGSIGQDEGSVITLDSSGNVIIAGRFSGSLDFDPSVNVNFKVSNGNRDIYLAKYDSLGNLIWANSMGGNLYDDAEDVLVDTVGNIYLAGSFQTTVDFDPEGGVELRVSNGLSDAYLACYSPSGIFYWVRTFGGNLDDDFSKINLDGVGFVYGSGLFSGATDFDGNVGVNTVSAAGSNDIFVVKYDLFGDFQWVKTMGGSGFDAAYGIEIAKEKLYLSGTFNATIDFDPNVGSFLETSQGSGDIFLCKLDTMGNFIWVNTAGGIGNDIGMDVGIDQYGFVVSTGMFRSSSTFSGGGVIKNLVALGDRDIYLDRFDSTGKLIHVFPISSVGVENSHTFYLNNKNNSLYISGFFGGTTDFDPVPSINTASSINGVTDIFFAKYSYLCDTLSPLQFINGSSVVCEGDTLVYQVDTLTICEECVWTFPSGSIIIDSLGAEVVFIAGDSSGVLEVFKSNSCFETPSVFFLIQINNKSISFINDSICSGGIYIFPDGTVGTTDTIQNSYFTNQEGCDSIIVTNLKLMSPVIINDSISICNGAQYFFYGSNYSLPGLYFHTISTPGFCDTTHSLLLSVLPPNLFLQNKIICDGDTLWVGSIAHTTTGVYIDTLVSSLFCDSIVISNVSQILIDTTVSISNGVYTSNQSNGTYQWYECGTVLSPVPNAIFQSYAVPTSGSYAVVINLNGCVDTSRCISVITSSFLDLNNSVSGVIVTPNPFMDQFNILSREIIEEVSVFSMDGKLLNQERVNHSSYNSISNSLSKGIYIITVRTKSGVSQIRLLKL
jgi:hypothetical protein